MRSCYLVSKDSMETSSRVHCKSTIRSVANQFNATVSHATRTSEYNVISLLDLREDSLNLEEPSFQILESPMEAPFLGLALTEQPRRRDCCSSPVSVVRDAMLYTRLVL